MSHEREHLNLKFQELKSEKGVQPERRFASFLSSGRLGRRRVTFDVCQSVGRLAQHSNNKRFIHSKLFGDVTYELEASR